MKTRIVFLLTLFVILACSQEERLITNSAPDLKNGTCTCSEFRKYLKADMDYNTFTSKFGLPSQDVGSGIHIYVYKLDDSTEVRIGYTNKIIYARHVDSDRVILDTII